jgi:hypothetical protein
MENLFKGEFPMKIIITLLVLSVIGIPVLPVEQNASLVQET